MIYVLSGGADKPYAVIAVTYPSGSICTCGGKAARDTSGYALFSVKVGTYTVECHTVDNSKSKSTSVTVTESDRGKSLSVMLLYELVLYENGVLHNESLSGGLLLHGETFTIKNPIAISVKRTYFGEGSHKWSGSQNLGTANAMSISEYSNFCINVTKNSGSLTTVLMCAASAVLDEVREANQGIISSLDISPLNVLGKFKMPLGSLSTTDVYLGVKVAGADPARQISIDKIWLE